jgi:hypothetical protein
VNLAGITLAVFEEAEMISKEEQDMLSKALAHANWQITQICKYQLPCGICDKTGEICRYIGGKE